jgi:hypothetical protein
MSHSRPSRSHRVDVAVSTVPFAHEIDARGDMTSVRMVCLHLIAEYARHNGHADMPREALDSRGKRAAPLCPGSRPRSCTSRATPPPWRSGANVAAFTLGNALGAWFGGVTIVAGLGHASPI